LTVVLDTNVFISAVFFGGVPGRILTAWRDGLLTLATSVEILNEYRAVANRLEEDFPEIDLNPLIALVTHESVVVDAPQLPQPVCDDPDNDMFLHVRSQPERASS